MKSTKKTDKNAFGWDGLTTFIFSNILILLTFGLALFILLFKVIQTATQSKTTISCNARAILITGLCLKNNKPIDEYKIRLNRVISILYALKTKPKIIILGGITGDNSISEAQAGADYLINLGINSKQVILEDKSRHTLENLQNARSILFSSSIQKTEQNFIIISSRYHIYRILSFAKGMNMTLHAIAAEKSLSYSPLTIMYMIKEAYFLHWYWSGILWVFITGNKKSKAKVS